jgi:5-methylcytosine-specific restriction protein A
MTFENDYIYKKEVDWSVLNQGLTIPIALQVQFKNLIKDTLPRGLTIPIKIFLDGNLYDAKLVNQNFDTQKYPTHKDIIQIRYEANSLLVQKLRNIFSSSYNYLLDFKQNDLRQEYKKRQIPVPDNQKEYLLLYTTTQKNIFLGEYITQIENRNINNELLKINEEEFELSTNYNKEDENARIDTRLGLVKVRKLDKSICDNLKELYNFRCQITGENFSQYHDTSVVEAHHIEYFTKSMNNNSDNILIVSPNYHRLIHKLNPIFDRNNLCFKFPNGLNEKIKLNLHL